MLPGERIRILRLMERMYELPEYFDGIGVCVEMRNSAAEAMSGKADE